LLLDRIAGHDLKVLACLNRAMPGSGRQYNGIAGAQLDFLTMLTTQHHPRRAAGHAEHLVSGGVVVMVVVNRPAPGRRPQMAVEKPFEGFGQIRAGQRQLAIDQHRMRTVGRTSVTD